MPQATKRATTHTKRPSLNTFLEQVKMCAFDLYNERVKANRPGDELQDWLKAEALIKAKYKM
jgi:hypothetical protein